MRPQVRKLHHIFGNNCRIKITWNIKPFTETNAKRDSLAPEHFAVCNVCVRMGKLFLASQEARQTLHTPTGRAAGDCYELQGIAKKLLSTPKRHKPTDERNEPFCFLSIPLFIVITGRETILSAKT